MTHYADLSRCNYFRRLKSGPLLAVGWLEPKHSYTRGSPGQAFYDHLKQLAENLWAPIHVMGGQECGFCRSDGYYSISNIFIPGSGVTYVSPKGILHYMAAHEYCPPPAYIKAVMACPPMNTPEYFAALQAAGWPPGTATYESQQ